MKLKEKWPLLIVATVATVLLVFAIISSSVGVSTIPITFMEKMGLYSSDSGFAYGTLNNTISLDGTHETLISVMKNVAINGTIPALLPIALLGVAFVLVLVLATISASKTSHSWTTYLCVALLLIVFCDFSNLAYFKTLHIYPLILILLLLICSLFSYFYKKEKVGVAGIILAFFAALAYSCLGNAQAVTSVVVGILLIRLYRLSSSKAASVLAVVLGAVLLVQSVAFAINYKPADYKQGLYNSVFYGVAKFDSVEVLGLDPKLNDFKEVYYGMKQDAEDYDLENTFYDKISYKKIMGYYITHPVNFIKLLNNEAKAAFYFESSMPFTLYSTVKKFYIPTGLPSFLVIALVYILVSLFVRKKYPQFKFAGELSIGLVVMWLLALVSSVVLNGNCEIRTSTYTFNTIFDIMLVFAAVGGIRVMLKTRDENKEKFGITRE